MAKEQAQQPEVQEPSAIGKREEQILSFWLTNSIFEKSLKKNEGKDEFVFYDGPPFATGLPHYGHMLAGTIKDAIPRFWTMRGKHVIMLRTSTIRINVKSDHPGFSANSFERNSPAAKNNAEKINHAQKGKYVKITIQKF